MFSDTVPGLPTTIPLDGVYINLDAIDFFVGDSPISSSLPTILLVEPLPRVPTKVTLFIDPLVPFIDYNRLLFGCG
jgi:hypothetical protein